MKPRYSISLYADDIQLHFENLLFFRLLPEAVQSDKPLLWDLSELNEPCEHFCAFELVLKKQFNSHVRKITWSDENVKELMIHENTSIVLHIQKEKRERKFQLFWPSRTTLTSLVSRTDSLINQLVTRLELIKNFLNN